MTPDGRDFVAQRVAGKPGSARLFLRASGIRTTAAAQRSLYAARIDPPVNFHGLRDTYASGSPCAACRSRWSRRNWDTPTPEWSRITTATCRRPTSPTPSARHSPRSASSSLRTWCRCAAHGNNCTRGGKGLQPDARPSATGPAATLDCRGRWQRCAPHMVSQSDGLLLREASGPAHRRRKHARADPGAL